MKDWIIAILMFLFLMVAFAIAGTLEGESMRKESWDNIQRG